MMAGSRRRRLEERELGNLIREARQYAGMSQTELAEAVGTKQSVISRWERGREAPRADTLAKVLRACGYETDIVLRPRDTGVDRAQIRDMLRRSPTERLREGEAMYEFVRSARRAS